MGIGKGLTKAASVANKGINLLAAIGTLITIVQAGYAAVKKPKDKATLD